MKLDMANEELRYLEYFGLGYNPFPVAPDNENFYISEHIDQILTELVHGIVARKGFMVLTGEIGLGKTTISRRIINILEENEVETSLILHTFYQDVELLREINKDFGLYTDNLELSDQMKVLNDFLINQNREGKNCAIIIDDAQNLNSKSLELIRMISNLETDREKLVQILLIGQPELMKKGGSAP
jgi:general secretion pathway protein A